MKVAVIMTGIGVLPGRTNNVSGHVQIPLKTCEILQDAGHSVTLIATRQEDGKAMPANMPNVPIKFVSDGRKRGQLGRQNARAGYHFFKLFGQIKQTVKLIKEADADIVHVFGFERMVRFGALLRIFSKKPTIITLMGQRPSSKWAPLYKRINHITCLTKSVANDWNVLGDKISVIYPGVVRDLSSPKPQIPIKDKNVILFWREASIFGGADLCREAFKALAPRFPEIRFEFAIRRNKDEVEGLDTLAKQHNNITIHRFPYENEFLLEELIDQSLCAVLPYKELSIEPQMTVVETLSVGCPVICSNIRSLPELVINGENGWTIRTGNTQELIRILETLLSDRKEIESMHEETAKNFNEKWNWQKYGDSLQSRYHDIITM